jgi:hypothetical protein
VVAVAGALPVLDMNKHHQAKAVVHFGVAVLLAVQVQRGLLLVLQQPHTALEVAVHLVIIQVVQAVLASKALF